MALWGCSGNLGDGTSFVSDTGKTFYSTEYQGTPKLLSTQDELSKREFVSGIWGYTMFDSKYGIPTEFTFTLLNKGDVRTVDIDTYGYAKASYSETSYEQGGWTVHDITVRLTPTQKFDDYTQTDVPLPFRLGVNGFYLNNHIEWVNTQGQLTLAKSDDFHLYLWKADTWCQTQEEEIEYNYRYAATGKRISEFELNPGDDEWLCAKSNIAEFYSDKDAFELYSNGRDAKELNAEYMENFSALRGQYEQSDDYEAFNAALRKAISEIYGTSMIEVETNYYDVADTLGKKIRWQEKEKMINPIYSPYLESGHSDKIEYYRLVSYEGKEFKIGGEILSVSQK